MLHADLTLQFLKKSRFAYSNLCTSCKFLHYIYAKEILHYDSSNMYSKV